MNRMSNVLVRMYPAAWRQRYGEEFSALVEETPPGWRNHWDLAKGLFRMHMSTPSFPKLAVLLGVAGLLGGSAASFLVAPQYASSATLVFEQRTDDIAMRMSRLQAMVVSQTSLSTLLQSPQLQLYPELWAAEPMENVVEVFRRNIKITLYRSEVGITFVYRDARKAQATVRALLEQLIDQSSRLEMTSLEASSDAKRIEALEMRIAQLEQRVNGGRSAVVAAAAVPGAGMAVLDTPSLPRHPFSPNRFTFAAIGLGLGVLIAMLIRIFRRLPPPFTPVPVG